MLRYSEKVLLLSGENLPLRTIIGNRLLNQQKSLTGFTINQRAKIFDN